jgi:predicted PurR-regulated permease PerM
MNELDTTLPPAVAANDWVSRRHVHSLVLIVATAAGFYLCFRLVVPFVAALAWALALAVLFHPLQRWLETKIKRANLTATITVFIVGLVVVLVAALVGERLVAEAVKGVTFIRARVESGDWTRVLELHPFLAPVGRWIENNTDFSDTLKGVASWLTTKGASILQGSVMKVISLLLTFYFLFFFLRDRRKALQAIRSLSPLPEAAMDRLFRRVVDTIHATLYGTLTVAAVQGTLGGLMFWWLGLPAPVLWGIVMGLLAVVPVLGAFIVWIPAAIFLAMDGSWGKAIVLTLWGSIVVGGIDNVLYPMLVGNRLNMHTVVAFVALVGGLLVLGPSGLILGPVAVAITTSLLEYWRVRNAEAKE